MSHMDMLVAVNERLGRRNMPPLRMGWRHHLRELDRWNKAKQMVVTDIARRFVQLLDAVHANDDDMINLYLLDEARVGWGRGWTYTPLNGKSPILAGWTSRPIEDLLDLERWVEAGHNLGLRTGAVSGVYVVDIDQDTIPGHFPETVTVKTGRGYHLYYRHVPGLRNTRNRLGDGIDTRGDGGQVVAVGSLHENGSIYQWVPGHSPEEIDLAEMPGWMLEALQ